MNAQSEIYKYHHKTNRERGFSVLKDQRGKLLRNLIGQGKKVLDIGCRDGALTQYFAQGNEVLGIDIDDNALFEAKKLGIVTRKLDLNGNWQELKKELFDVVVAGEVLEHLYYPERIVEKVTSLLNSKGLFLGSVPNAFSLKNRFRYLIAKKDHTPLSDPTHINHFSAKDLENMLKKHFSQVKIIGLGRFTKLAKIYPNFFAFDLFFVARL